MGSDVKVRASRLNSVISIHAPRVGSDLATTIKTITTIDFNPRSPCGERRPSRQPYRKLRHFNPRSPCGERLNVRARLRKCTHFNPRSPCGERPSVDLRAETHTHFNPRSPCGERHQSETLQVSAFFISIHAPRVGSDSVAHAVR